MFAFQPLKVLRQLHTRSPTRVFEPRCSVWHGRVAAAAAFVDGDAADDDDDDDDAAAAAAAAGIGQGLATCFVLQDHPWMGTPWPPWEEGSAAA